MKEREKKICWELEVLLLQNFAYEEALLSYVHPFFCFTRPFLSELI